MQDSRLIHATSDTRSAKENVFSALRTIRTLLDEGVDDVHEAVSLERAEKLLSAAFKIAEEAQQALRDAAAPMVCYAHVPSGQCVLPLGHSDSHSVVAP